MGLHIIFVGGVANETTPAAANVQEAVTWLQPQLTTDHVELRLLRGRKIRGHLWKVGA